MIIYVIEHRKLKKRYVGKTQRTLLKRLYEHRSYARRGSRYPIHCAIRKYGFDAFDVKIVETFKSNDASVLNDAERHWIATLAAKVEHGGYNLTDGGDGVVGHTGWHHTQKAKDAIGRGNKGLVRSNEVRTKISVAVRSSMTDQVKRKIADGTKSALAKPETRGKMLDVWKRNSKRVEQRTLDGILIEVFPSAREASRQTGVNHGNMCSCCRGSTHQAGGFIWHYEEI